MMSACADKLLLLHGLVDGELDAANALAVEQHLKGCSGCSEELGRIELARATMATPGLAYRAPASLRATIEAQIAAEAGSGAGAKEPTPRYVRPPHRPGADTRPIGPRHHPTGFGAIAAHVGSGRWASGALTGIAAGLALMLAMPQFTQAGIEDQLVGSHVRSLMANHLTDIATSNRHVVKPWFNGRVDFAPPVPELAAKGFPLVGGRLDYIDGHTVAAIVYHRRLHSINLFVRPAGTLSLPGAMSSHRDGYTLVRWTKGGLEYWAVSDIDPADLELFQRIFSAAS